MNSSKIAFLLASIALVAPADVIAQEDTLLAVGKHVRISKHPKSMRYGDPLVGVLTEVRQDTLVLLLDKASRTLFVPLGAVKALEVQRGQKSYTGVGLLIGMATGAAVGAAIGHSLGDDYCSGWDCLFSSDLTAGEKATYLGLAGAVGGALLGALVGSFIKTDRWEGVPLDELRIEPSPIATDGVSVSASLRL